MKEPNLIRNFSIIAHIDHGKSTLADRILQFTGTITEREFHEQMLDDMAIEQERGITIKASAVRLNYKAKDGLTYVLNLIDTPGHVDFTYEVSKSLAACEGALLVVDASQGVEAQTVANLYLAMENNLEIIPVINKIDLFNAEPEKVREQISNILGISEEEIILASAKLGTGTEDILEHVITKIPPPKGSYDAPLQALIFDSSYDTYRGVIVFVKIANGRIVPRMNIKFMGKNAIYEVLEVGVTNPHPTPVDELGPGEVGYIFCNIRSAKEVDIGDTVTDAQNPAALALKGYKQVRPMVFCGVYPVASKDFEQLRDSLEKLKLSDASFIYEPESSASLGFGFRCGFLGLLHMEIVEERLEREYDQNLVFTTPSVVYRIKKNDGAILEIDNPTKLPTPNFIDEISEPIVAASLIVPADSIGAIMELAESRRGEYISTEYLTTDKVKIVYYLPLSEIIVDFYDKIKSMTRGYGSLDYEFLEYKHSKLVKLDILINGEPCDALSSIVHREKAQIKGRALAEKLKELIPRQMFEIAVQAAIGGNIIARETIPAMKKNVTAKCYGGDITRKRKLWEKQKEGKKRMKQFGRVDIPQEAFLAALKI